MIIIFLSILSSCGKSKSIDSNVPKYTDANVQSQKEEIGKLNLKFKTISAQNIWESNYSQSILHYLGRAELSTLIDTEINANDLKMLGCSGYSRSSIFEKKKFWVIFMASIAHAESSLNPRAVYREKDGTLSSGLLQIDVLSANRHTQTYTDYLFSQQDLFNTDLNLMAGLYIMKHQLEGSINAQRPELIGRLFTDRSYYWSVLTLKRDLIIKSFLHNSRFNLPFCGDNDRP